MFATIAGAPLGLGAAAAAAASSRPSAFGPPRVTASSSFVAVVRRNQPQHQQSFRVSLLRLPFGAGAGLSVGGNTGIRRGGERNLLHVSAGGGDGGDKGGEKKPPKKSKKFLRRLVKRASDVVDGAYLESMTLQLAWNTERTRLVSENQELAADAARLRVMLSDHQRLDAILSEVRSLREQLTTTGQPSSSSSSSSSVAVAQSQEERDMRRTLDALTAPVLPAAAELAAAAATAAAAADDDDATEVVIDSAQWMGDGTDRSALWPMVKAGNDDIYLMCTIHKAMNDAGFWAGEEDEAEFYFGPSTTEALCYFQAANANAGLYETGMVDADTWRALVGEKMFRHGPTPGAIGFEGEVEGGEGSAMMMPTP
eukprot:CAMPEP_0197576434 /NCGR_PEP_ID=MMETSP1326-20131121/1461_1 /TAXON_ID=1155430 /ORGANISM="Genus nov. species nov., Strain RCC2288" /LENGTH=368 /DNA_ID=CAMNT_0043139363 /DNA_START=186 /DNA_END=1288 /DNA_ORIENTATION=-